MDAQTKIERRLLAETLYKEYQKYNKKLNAWGTGYIIEQCTKLHFVIQYKSVRDMTYGVTYEM